jgi:hypothetical protein
MYQLFYDGEEPPKLPNLLKRKSSGEIAWGSSGKDARFLPRKAHLPTVCTPALPAVTLLCRPK